MQTTEANSNKRSSPTASNERFKTKAKSRPQVPQEARASIPSPISLTLNLSPRSSNRAINLSSTLRHSTTHLTRQHISEVRECLALPAQILITALYELDELACVDVWVSGGVDVIDYFWWELDAGEGGVGGVGFWLGFLGLRELGVR